MAGPGTAMSVRARLGLFTSLLVALMLTLGAIAVGGDQAASDRVSLQARNLAPTLQANAQLTTDLRSAESSVTNYLLLRHALEGAVADPQDATQVLVPARNLIQSLPADLDRIDHLTALTPFDDAELVGNLADLVQTQRASMSAWRDWAMRVVPAVGEPQAALPARDVVDEGERLFSITVRDNSSVQSALAATNAAVRQHVLDLLDRTRRVLIAATILAVALALFVAWRTTLRLVGPLQALRETIRRQVAGERSAWADTGSGAREIRELAEGVNVLNREHLRLVDRQAQSLALLRAGNDVVATLASVKDPQEAVELVVDTIGRTLGVDVTRIAGWSSGRSPFAAVWSRDKSPVGVPETWWHSGEAGAPLLPAGELVAVGAGARPGRGGTEPTPDWVEEDPVVARSTSSLFLPIALGDKVNGLLSVHSASDVRTWDEPEIAYLQRVTRELARLSGAQREG